MIFSYAASRIFAQERDRGLHPASSQVNAVRDGATLDRPLRVAVIGGGPGGACAADTLAKNGIEAFLIERKLDNCKVGSPVSHRWPTSCCARCGAPEPMDAI